MQPKYTYEQLIEKMVRAKVSLEKGKRAHSDSCRVETDPEGYAPCSCGASASNQRLQEAIDKLKF